jgi:hypothetical protein
MSDSISPSKDDKPFEPKGGPLPPRSGSQALPENKWYYLKLQYVDDNGKVQDSFAYFVGNQASWSFWDYISATPSNGDKAKFKNVSSDGNRMQLQLQDGNYLSCRASGFIGQRRGTPCAGRLPVGSCSPITTTGRWAPPMNGSRFQTPITCASGMERRS